MVHVRTRCFADFLPKKPERSFSPLWDHFLQDCNVRAVAVQIGTEKEQSIILTKVFSEQDAFARCALMFHP